MPEFYPMGTVITVQIERKTPMSCMILTAKHINVVVNVIASGHSFTWADQPTRRASDLDKLGAALMALNVKAYYGRYPSPHRVIPEPFRYSPLGHINDVDAYKALVCLHYQLCEDATENDKLTKALDDVSTTLAHKIVSNLPAYQAAPWGIE